MISNPRLSLTCLLSILALTSGALADESAEKTYPIPDPEQSLVVEFANSMDGTDGTPDDIGKKAQAASALKKKKAPPAKREAPVRRPSSERAEPVTLGY